MKFGQAIGLNIVTVVVALAAYHHLAGDDGTVGPRSSSARDGVAVGELERRLEALEARRPAAAAPSDSGIEARLAALEAALKASPKPARVPTEQKEAKPASRKPGADDVVWFRAVRDAVRRDDAVRKNRKLVDAALSKLSIRLTNEQREAVHAARASFGSRVDEIWTEIKTEAGETKAAGGEVDGAALFRRGQTRIQEEFAASLADVIPHGATRPRSPPPCSRRPASSAAPPQPSTKRKPSRYRFGGRRS